MLLVDSMLAMSVSAVKRAMRVTAIECADQRVCQKCQMSDQIQLSDGDECGAESSCDDDDGKGLRLLVRRRRDREVRCLVVDLTTCLETGGRAGKTLRATRQITARDI